MILVSDQIPKPFLFQLLDRNTERYGHNPGGTTDLNGTCNSNTIHYFGHCHIEQIGSTLQTVVNGKIQICTGANNGNRSGIFNFTLIPFFGFFLRYGLFTLMVKMGVGNNALNGLYFYPKPVREKVFELGLIDPETVAKKRKCFMIAFFAVMAVTLILVIRVWNGVHNFWPAYLQALLFLEVMNWYDGIVIDRLWVGHSNFWVIPGTEEIPFVQTWRQVLKKRGTLTVIWIAGAAIIAGIVMIF